MSKNIEYNVLTRKNAIENFFTEISFSSLFPERKRQKITGKKSMEDLVSNILIPADTLLEYIKLKPRDAKRAIEVIKTGVKTTCFFCIINWHNDASPKQITKTGFILAGMIIIAQNE